MKKTLKITIVIVLLVLISALYYGKNIYFNKKKSHKETNINNIYKSKTSSYKPTLIEFATDT